MFKTLIEWANEALERSSNQPSLPHAIIVFNASDTPHNDTKSDDAFWDIDVTTEKILSSLSRLLRQSDAFDKYEKFWRKMGRSINSFQDLVECYYSSVQVSVDTSFSPIRLPTVTDHPYPRRPAAKTDPGTGGEAVYLHPIHLWPVAYDQAVTSHAV